MPSCRAAKSDLIKFTILLDPNGLDINEFSAVRMTAVPFCHDQPLDSSNFLPIFGYRRRGGGSTINATEST